MVKKRVLFLCTLVFMGCQAKPDSRKVTEPVENIAENTSAAIMEKAIMTWPDLTGRPLPQATTSINYSDQPTGIVDVWLPDGKGPHPVVLMIHGGCWQKSIADRTLMNYAAEDLRQKGMAVWNIEYRGVDEPGGGYPGTFDDVAMAGNVLTQHAAEFNLDMGRIAGFGHSAGGHLITWYAGSRNLPPNSKIRFARSIEMVGMINSGGLADLKTSEPMTLSSCLAAIRPKLTGPVTDSRSDPYADTSSDRLLPSGIAVHNVNGQKDRIAPLLLGEAFTKEVIRSGDVAYNVSIEGEGHVELIAPGSKAFDRQSEILMSLLNAK